MKYYTDKANYYMSKGVATKVNPIFIYLMLSMIEEDVQKGIEQDYLKVFELSNVVKEGKRYLTIRVHQECSKHESFEELCVGKEDDWFFDVQWEENPIRIRIISDGVYEDNENVTILVPSEY